MTTEEAIKFHKRNYQAFIDTMWDGDEDNNPYEEAFRMAISALGSIDKIKTERDAAVNSLRTTFGNCQFCKHNDFLTHRCKSTPKPGKCWEWKGIQNDK